MVSVIACETRARCVPETAPGSAAPHAGCCPRGGCYFAACCFATQHGIDAPALQLGSLMS